MDIIKTVGMIEAFKGFIIFLFYGFLTTLYIALFYGLEADLPDPVAATLEGPLSIYPFGLLSVVGLFLLALVTNFGENTSNIDRKRPKRVFYIALPLCESAIALGVIIGGTCLGAAMCTHLVFALSCLGKAVHPKLYAISAFMFLVTYPVAHFTIAFVDSRNSLYSKLKATGLGYALVVLVLAIITLPIPNVVIIGWVFTLFLALWAYFKSPKLQGRKAKK